MKVISLSHEESLDRQLGEFVFERNTQFAQFSEGAARLFDSLNPTKEVIDLGCGDGVSTGILLDLGYKVTAVDVNPEKLAAIDEKATKVCMDFLDYLKSVDEVPNLFSHHALEHTVRVEEIMEELSKKVKGICFIIVPGDGELRGTHHTAFTIAEDLIPKGFAPIDVHKFERGEPEIWAISKRV